jgi:cold shock CspA family protein
VTGIITRVFKTRGFAFSGEYFVHIDDFLAKEDWDIMREGRQIEFEPTMTSKGKLRALKVRIVK